MPVHAMRACVRACMHMSCDLSAGVVGVEETEKSDGEKKKVAKGARVEGGVGVCETSGLFLLTCHMPGYEYHMG
jgi:hypothetical protein